ncbi:type II secretion system protein [Sulfurimonas lithotrophica]|uniref:Type II secretion system protein n=1 Tax=Sulfurimonas lithotrophica TaxID=2590022 RepID=A0A5P8NYL7_9BACT|nr:type II secretion system protein [Sulfurimonas lithotrophica]QFR48533.1 type II secretion system protein [Sulfurimonas lithotrophica]
MKKTKKNGFTMIEMVFVIVVLGILAAIAVPRFAVTRTDAQISKGRSDIASIRSGIINERQTRIIQGDSSWISDINLDLNNTSTLFGGVLMYGIPSEDTEGHWYTATAGNGSYIFKSEGQDVVFTYDDTTGIFTCNRTHATYGEACKHLID